MQITLHIREIRNARGMTIQQLSDKGYLTASAIGNMERGVKTPSLPSLCLIAKALGCTLDELVTIE